MTWPEQSGARRVGEIAYEPGVGHDDAIIRHIGASFLEGLRRPDETNQLFIDHMMLALTAHVAQAYGGLQPAAEPARGGLAPWQVKRACEKLESDLGGKVALEQIAAEFDLSVSHFSRAFRISTGLPPHQWLLRQRVKAAKQLMTVRNLPLSEIAISAGFANQSHFTRVFSPMVGVSPGAWRRETHGAPENKTSCDPPVSDDLPARSRGGAARRKHLVRRTTDAFGKVGRIEDGPVACIVWFDAGDHDRSQS